MSSDFQNDIQVKHNSQSEPSIYENLCNIILIHEIKKSI